jgi:AraC family transcriptional regulator
MIGWQIEWSGAPKMQADYERRIEPLAEGWSQFAWDIGKFDTAYRSFTPQVEGTIRTPQHLIMVTLKGEAQSVEVQSDCGHRFVGPDRVGAVSFVPAHCRRRLQMTGVASQWASISLSPDLFTPENADGRLNDRAFTNADDAFVHGSVVELARLFAQDHAVDGSLCDSMSWALARYLVARYGKAVPRRDAECKLPHWRMRRLTDFIEAHLDEPVRIAVLAELVGLSPGYFHRAFRATTGQTPLDYINRRRIERAKMHLDSTAASMAAVGLKVGFVSPSHFTRTFRQMTGTNPSRYRKDRRGRTS